jgi:predicted phage terminase large subunit-like protein
MNMARPLAAHAPLDSLPQSETSMTEKDRSAVDDEVTRIRMRYHEALRAGMSIAEATAYANGPENRSAIDDDVTRIRRRHLEALRAGMSTAEATAYANGPDSAEPSGPARARVELAVAPSADAGSDAAQLNSGAGSESVATAARLSPKPAFSACAAGDHDKMDPDRLVHHPDRVVFQALLAQDLMAFTEFAFGVVRPGLPFKPNWHLEAITAKLSQVARGEIRRLIITLPPRTLKSLCASVALPAWFLGHHPSERVVVVSYSDFLTRNHANDFRLLVKHPIYQATFPAMRLERDTDREITTTTRGKRIATSLEGTLTGLGGNLIIIDDPLKLGDAMSEAVRARVIEWYRSTLLSRGDDKAATRIVVVMQRVHQLDLVGYLQEQGGFEILNLPAIAQRSETFDLGGGRTYTRQRAELLHPEHEPVHVLAELRREMGPIAFSAQYQQSPIPPGGTIIRRNWLTTYDHIQCQPGDTVVMSWDIALSEAETGDYSACVVLLRRGEVYYVLEVVRGRFLFEALKRKVMEVKQRYGCAATLLIEESPISRGLIQSLREQSINVTPYKPDTDKRARLISQCDLFEGGSVRFPRRAAWLEEFTAELLAFPGRHDDQVDALAQGLAWGRHDGTYKHSWGYVLGLY